MEASAPLLVSEYRKLRDWATDAIVWMEFNIPLDGIAAIDHEEYRARSVLLSRASLLVPE
jgi:hypothetical protein